MTDILRRSSPLAPEAQPLVEDLIREYDGRYGTRFDREGARAELHRYPPEAFAPPVGDFLLLIRDGETIGGGAYMPHDDPETAELKRIWTRSDLRRQGLARRIVLALEDSAAAQGYTRLYLTTGFRQPEADALYVSMGYRRLFDPAVDLALYLTLPFEKHIGAKAGQPGTSPLREPAATAEEAVARVREAKAAHTERMAARYAAAARAVG